MTTDGDIDLSDGLRKPYLTQRLLIPSETVRRWVETPAFIEYQRQLRVRADQDFSNALSIRRKNLRVAAAAGT